MEEKVILTNMCMIYDDKGNVLVQDRLNKDWAGITFPGGHVEKDEAFTDSVIREIKEETGLDISSPKLCGIEQFPTENGARYIILFYKTDKFSGQLCSSEEGEVFWAQADKLKEMPLSRDFKYKLAIFMNDDLQEFQWIKDNGAWIKRII